MLQQLTERHTGDPSVNLDAIRHNKPAVAYPDEPLRVVVQRMAETGLTRFPVVDRDRPTGWSGIISLDDLLKARALNLEAERRRERIMRMDLSFPFKFRRARETV